MQKSIISFVFYKVRLIVVFCSSFVVVNRTTTANIKTYLSHHIEYRTFRALLGICVHFVARLILPLSIDSFTNGYFTNGYFNSSVIVTLVITLLSISISISISLSLSISCRTWFGQFKDIVRPLSVRCYDIWLNVG